MASIGSACLRTLCAATRARSGEARSELLSFSSLLSLLVETYMDAYIAGYSELYFIFESKTSVSSVCDEMIYEMLVG
jgi:hypothetical protein